MIVIAIMIMIMITNTILGQGLRSCCCTWAWAWIGESRLCTCTLATLKDSMPYSLAHYGGQQAEALKNEGNAAFTAKDYETAVAKFTAAIEADANYHVAYSNRSAAYSAMGK